MLVVRINVVGIMSPPISQAGAAEWRYTHGGSAIVSTLYRQNEPAWL